MANVITEWQTKLKGLVLKCLKINLSDLKLKVQKSFATLIPKIAKGFIMHDNMTVTLNEPGGTHQTAPMTERYGPAGQPGHRPHATCPRPPWASRVTDGSDIASASSAARN